MNYSNIIVTKENGYALIQLNRPDVLNAINIALMKELVDALDELEKEDDVRCVVLTGNEKAFAAGADIKEMADASTVEMLRRDMFSRWDRIRKFKKPLIAAVGGYALGGGCELAMTCDIIIASESAKFGQPEISIGVIPGAGGTQRLTRAVGKYKAMEMVLSGAMITAEEAKQWGLAVKVVPNEYLLEEAKNLAKTIASKPPVALQLGKEAILKAFDTTIESGLEFERKNFYMLFSTEDQKEGMKAFVEKRKPEWKGK
ncbi:MAG: enoyl-CoA hydratase/isomerase family protein [Bacteroidota bacterium]|nr:enoyl-CoA hydratase/isomerase family protein [Bacteroidota bacterium]